MIWRISAKNYGTDYRFVSAGYNYYLSLRVETKSVVRELHLAKALKYQTAEASNCRTYSSEERAKTT